MLGLDRYFQILGGYLQMKEEQKRREKEQQDGKKELQEVHPEDNAQGKTE